ncbi:hypothetical protein BKA62DRAFT_725776 [Auriculariales sp. MPI-PUGE-AT-0066]|nr:hypothetical protein BKA62DRAFT_725776 [Auriculariales sp. MPI-PUGE-AT-0066]
MPLAVTLLAHLVGWATRPSSSSNNGRKRKLHLIRSGGDDRESSVDISIQISLDFLKGCRTERKDSSCCPSVHTCPMRHTQGQRVAFKVALISLQPRMS